MKYQSWLDSWFALYIVPVCKPKTAESYRGVIRNHLVPCLGQEELEALTPVRLQGFLAERAACGNRITGGPLSPSSVNLIAAVLKGSLSCACRVGLIPFDPTGRLSRPRGSERLVGCFSAEEQSKIERAVLDRDRPYLWGIVLCLYTGLRLGELLALRWEDIDFSSRTLSVTKSCRDGRDGAGNAFLLTGAPKTASSVRILPLPRQIVRLLRLLRRRSGGEYVILHGGRRVSLRGYQRMFERLLKRKGIPPRGFHALRHTFATRAIECGMDVKTLSELLGHRSPAVTLKRYVHSVLLHKVRMMDKLGERLSPGGRGIFSENSLRRV